jgi:hypothetical protein
MTMECTKTANHAKYRCTERDFMWLYMLQHCCIVVL